MHAFSNELEIEILVVLCVRGKMSLYVTIFEIMVSIDSRFPLHLKFALEETYLYISPYTEFSVGVPRWFSQLSI